MTRMTRIRQKLEESKGSKERSEGRSTASTYVGTPPKRGSKHGFDLRGHATITQEPGPGLVPANGLDACLAGRLFVGTRGAVVAGAGLLVGIAPAAVGPEDGFGLGDGGAGNGGGFGGVFGG